MVKPVKYLSTVINWEPSEKPIEITCHFDNRHTTLGWHFHYLRKKVTRLGYQHQNLFWDRRKVTLNSNFFNKIYDFNRPERQSWFYDGGCVPASLTRCAGLSARHWLNIMSLSCASFAGFSDRALKDRFMCDRRFLIICNTIMPTSCIPATHHFSYSNHIENETGSQNITNMWRDHYK